MTTLCSTSVHQEPLTHSGVSIPKRQDALLSMHLKACILTLAASGLQQRSGKHIQNRRQDWRLVQLIPNDLNQPERHTRHFWSGHCVFIAPRFIHLLPPLQLWNLIAELLFHASYAISASSENSVVRSGDAPHVAATTRDAHTNLGLHLTQCPCGAPGDEKGNTGHALTCFWQLERIARPEENWCQYQPTPPGSERKEERSRLRREERWKGSVWPFFLPFLWVHTKEGVP